MDTIIEESSDAVPAEYTLDIRKLDVAEAITLSNEDGHPEGD